MVIVNQTLDLVTTSESQHHLHGQLGHCIANVMFSGVIVQH